jgi:hypothetical protein
VQATTVTTQTTAPGHDPAPAGQDAEPVQAPENTRDPCVNGSRNPGSREFRSGKRGRRKEELVRARLEARWGNGGPDGQARQVNGTRDQEPGETASAGKQTAEQDSMYAVG